MAEELPGIVQDGPLVMPRQWPDLRAPTGLEQLGAGLVTENTVVHGFAQPVLPKPDEQQFRSEWDVRDSVTFDEFMTGRFDSAQGDNQVEAIRANIQREQRLRDIVQRGPLSPLVVGLAAAGVDPFSYVGPLAAPFRALGVGGRALTFGADAAISIGASEVALSSQQLRPGTEALASMLLGTVFSGAIGAAIGRGSREYGTALAPTPRYDSLREELATYMASVSANEGSLARLQDTTAVGRFMDSPSLKWTMDRHPPPPGVLDDSDLLRFSMGRSTKLFDNVEAAARKFEALDNPLELALARTAPDLTPSRIEREGIISQIIELEGRANPAAEAARVEGKSLDDILKAIDAAPSARLDPVATTQAAALRQRLKELDSALPLRVTDDAGPLTWQVDKAKEAALKEYQDALAKLHAQLERERARMAKLTAKLGPEGIAEAQNTIITLAQTLAKGEKVDMPGTKWLDEIAARNAFKDVVDKGPQPLKESTGLSGPKENALYKPAKDEPLGLGPIGGAIELDNTLADTFRLAPMMAKLGKWGLMSPSVELGASLSPTMRGAVNRVAETGLMTNNQINGVSAKPRAMDLMSRMSSETKATAVKEAVDLHYGAYYQRAKAAGETPMKERDFLKAAAKANREGDVHPVKEVADLAKFGRTIMEALWKQAEDVGVPLPEKTIGSTAKSYFPRDYLAEEIARRRGVDGRSLESIIAKGVRASDPKLTAEEALDIGRTSVAAILGSPSGRIPRELNLPGARGGFKERTLRVVNDRDIAEFLNDDWLDVMMKHVKTMAHDIEFYRTFPDGYKSVDELLDQARKEFDAIAGAAKTDSARSAIARQAEREERVLHTLIERTRGVSTIPIDANYTGLTRTAKAVTQVNYMRLMGSGLLSQLPDAGLIVMGEGFGRTVGALIGPLVNGIGSLKIGAATLRRFEGATDFVSLQRMNATADMVEHYGHHSRVERLLDTGAKWFGMASLMTPWTMGMKAIASTLVTDRMLADLVHVANGGERSAAVKTKWLNAGVSDRAFNEMLKEVPNFAKEGAHWVPNIDKWKSASSVDAFGYALVSEVNNRVLRPGAVDKPLWMSTNVGKVLTQFQGFGWASNQRILLAGLQRRDAQTFSGWTMMLGLGVMVTAAKDLYNKGQIDPDRNVGGWIRDGLDRSGLASLFMQYDNYADKAFGLSVARTLTNEGASKYAGRGLLEQIAGPSAGFVTDLQKGLYGAVTGDFLQSDLHKMFRLTPGLGLPFIKQGFDAIEAASGLPEKQVAR